MKVSSIAVVLPLICLTLPACKPHGEGENQDEHHTIVATSPLAKDVIIKQPYVCQIRAQKYVEIRAIDEGYLEEIPVKEGQHVRKDQVMFRVVPTLYKTRLDSELAELKLVELEYSYTKVLVDSKQQVLSPAELAIQAAKVAKVRAKVAQAQTELDFATVKAPFDGIMDRLNQMQGSLIKKEEFLTTLSDNRVMWVYFNVPEARYLDFNYHQDPNHEGPSHLTLPDSHMDLILADGRTFDPTGGKSEKMVINTVTVEGKFNNETGNIPFRVDFPNPNRLLRHGQTGTVLIHRLLHKALVIPQRATFEVLDKQYVWVIGDDKVVHRRLITIAHELEDNYVIQSGLTEKDKIVLEGVQQVHDGDKLADLEFEKPEVALAHEKLHAE